MDGGYYDGQIDQLARPHGKGTLYVQADGRDQVAYSGDWVHGTPGSHEEDASAPFSIPTKGKCPTCGLYYDETPSACPACKNSYMGLRDREVMPGYDVARAVGASVGPELPG